MKRKAEIDAINHFKLLALIIIANVLRVIELLVNERTDFENTYIMPQIPLICEYLIASLTIYIIGFLIWYFYFYKINFD